MDGTKVPPRSAAAELAGLLDAPEIERLVSEPEASRSTASGQHDSLELALHE
jgi:hypothetical protein